MKKPKRKRAVQLYLPQPGPPLPAWTQLPETCRKKVVGLMVEVLRQYAQTGTAAGKGGRDE